MLRNLAVFISHCLILILAFFVSANVSASQSPNILLIQVDDMGIDDMSYRGNEYIQTPNLDQLAKDSARFDNFYVSSLCAPSRAALLTGRHFLKTGVSGVHGGRDYINLNETLISELLQDKGYQTGFWGKWHSGKTNGYLPHDRGFGEAYYASLYNYFDNTGLLNGHQVNTKGYADDRIADFAIDFITRNKAKPFFAYVSFMAPHNPWRAPEHLIKHYQAKGLSFPMASLYGMIDRIDYNTGRLIDKLDQLNISNKTIVIFLSDNGPWVKSYRFGLNEDEWKSRNPNNLRGHKAENWQNGVLSPLFIRWPEHIKPAVYQNNVQVEDVFPTLLDYTQTQPDKSLELDGISLKPLLSKGKALPNRRLFHAWASPLVPSEHQNALDKNGFYRLLTPAYIQQIKASEQKVSVLDNEIKLLLNESKTGSVHLFDLKEDPGESINIASQLSDKTKQLTDKAHAWYQDILNSQHAFKPPEFQIGYAGREKSIIYALAGSYTSENLINLAHYLQNWRNKGDFANYQIKVHSPGTYKINLLAESDSILTTEYKLTCGQNSSKGRFSSLARNINNVPVLIRNESAYWDDFDKPETFRKSIYTYSLGKISLSEECKTLKFELLEDLPKNSHKLKMIAFDLQKIRTD